MAKRFKPPTIEECDARLEKCEAHFACFWEAYPKRNGKRVGKKDCQEWWLKVKPNVEMFTGMIAWLRIDGQCRVAAQVNNVFYAAPKDPIRWLKGYGWEDDIGGVGDVVEDKYAGKQCGKSLYKNHQPVSCRNPVTFSKADSTGQLYYRCDKHKPKRSK